MPKRNARVLVAMVAIYILSTTITSRHTKVLQFIFDEVQYRALAPPSADALLEGALDGVTSRLDRHSTYIPPRRVAAFNESIDAQFAGVGVQVGWDAETETLLVTSPIFDAPAYRAGIRAGDRIIAIDGESTKGLSIEECSRMMRGPEGEPVTLTVVHYGDDDPVEIDVVRDMIEVDTVMGDLRRPDGSWDFILEADARIGYVWINSFSEHTPRELGQALDQLIESDAEALIIDLRDDPGGFLQAAIRLSDMFVREGVIVSTRSRRRVTQEFRASPDGTITGLPIVLLVNENTASAAEIFAACLQDHDVADVAGTRTHGKGTIQEIIELGDKYGTVKLTTATYVRPSGKNINRSEDATEEDDWGVRPDAGLEIALSDEEKEKWYAVRRERLTVPMPTDATTSDDPGDPEDDFERPLQGPVSLEDYHDPQLAQAVKHLWETLGPPSEPNATPSQAPDAESDDQEE